MPYVAKEDFRPSKERCIVANAHFHVSVARLLLFLCPVQALAHIFEKKHDSLGLSAKQD
jgi:hypothetical protein